MTTVQAIITIAIISIITALLRMLPFIIFNGKTETPKFLVYLGRVLPYAMMAMLVVYCFKNVSILNAPFGIPEVIASIVVILLHLWKRQPLVSMGLGTALYMFLVQVVF